MQDIARNPNIDSLRLLAAIGVVSLHVGTYPEANSIIGDTITSIFRWCVPSFIIITGYYISDASGVLKTSLERVSRHLWLFVFFSLIYFPIFLARFKLGAIGPEILIRGTDIHLWYLSAVPIGLLGVRMIGAKRSLAIGISIGILLIYISASYFFAFTHKIYGTVMIAREFVAIPCLYAGALLRQQRTPSVRLYAILTIIGATLLVIELYFVTALKIRATDIQFSLSTLPIAFGLVGMMVATKRKLAPDFISNIGRRESLGLYAWHRMFMIVAASLLAKKLVLNFDGLPGVALWLLTTAFALLTLCAIRAISTKARAAMDGQFAPAHG